MPLDLNVTRSRPFRILPVAAVAMAAILYGQSCPTAEIRSAFQDLDFSESMPGMRPAGWNPASAACYLPPHGGYDMDTAAGDVCYTGRHCAYIKSVKAGTADRLWFMFQLGDASQYRGKMLNLQAAVRIEASSGSVARLLVRVHRLNGETTFRDDMGDHPVSSPIWSVYQIHAPIAPDARDIELGLQVVGQGTAWIDDISVVFVDL
jgi:hypothetical protein